MIRDIKQAQILVEDYEDAIDELGEEDQRAINAWLRAVEVEVAKRKFLSFNNRRANFGRASAIELLHLRLFGNLKNE
jgi:hypothetical protein